MAVAIAILISLAQPGLTRWLSPMRTATVATAETAASLDSVSLTTTDIQTISWTFRADRFRERWGDDITLYCPPNGSPQQIWGSDVYSDNSSVCTAAAHAGLITVEEGGAIAIRILRGRSAYDGHLQNDIASSSIGEWPGSFTFTSLRDFVAGVMVATDGVLPIRIATWTTPAASLAIPTSQPRSLQVAEQPIAVYCPAAGQLAPVWGSDIYRDTSSVCSAAVHAGRLSLELGGTIAFKLAARQPFYIGSSRNGITTRHGLGGDRSFIFIE